MTTRTENTVTIPFPPATVHAALTNRAYWEHNVANLSTEAGQVHEFTANDNGSGEAVLYELMPMDLLPEAVRAMVSQSLKIKRVVFWGPLEDGKAEGDYTADVKGAPVDFKGDMELTGDDSSTTIHYTGEVNVNLAFMGSAIEPKVAEALGELTQGEADLTTEWIRNNS